MTKFCGLRAKTYSFLIDEYTDDHYEKNKIINKKAKGTKKCVIKRERQRQRDRETERQRDRETERQRDRETERERSYLIIMLIHCLKMKYC